MLVGNGQLSSIMIADVLNDQLANRGTLQLDNMQMNQPQFLGSGCIVLSNLAMYTFATTFTTAQKHRLMDTSSGLIFPPISANSTAIVEGYGNNQGLFFKTQSRREARMVKAVGKPTYSYDTGTGILSVGSGSSGFWLIDIGPGYDASQFLSYIDSNNLMVIRYPSQGPNAISSECIGVSFAPNTMLAVVTSTTLYTGSQTTTTTIIGTNAPGTVL